MPSPKTGTVAGGPNASGDFAGPKRGKWEHRRPTVSRGRHSPKSIGKPFFVIIILFSVGFLSSLAVACRGSILSLTPFWAEEP